MTARAERPAVPGWVVVALGLACYWRIGYGYGTGDHEEILPQLLRALDPTLFPRDPYLLAEDDAFSVRFVFLGLLRALCAVVPPPVAVLALTVASWLGVSGSAARLALTLTLPARRAAPAASGAKGTTSGGRGPVLGAALAVLATLATVHWTPGGNAVITRTLVPEALAWTPVLLAVDAFARGRWAVSAGLLGLAGWLQPLIGLQFGLLLGLVSLWRAADGDARGALARAVGFGAVFFAVAAPVLVPTLLTQAGTAPPDDGLTTFYVTAWLRQAHHYLLSAQAPGTLARFAAVVAAGLWGLAVLRRRGAEPRHVRFTLRLLAVTAALVALYVVGTEGAESLAVAKTQLFRLTVLAKLVLLAWAASGVVALAPPGWRRLPPAASGWALALAAVAVTAGLGWGGVGRPAALWRPAVHARTDLFRAEDWARRRTPRDAVFLVPPETTTFRSHALRSVAVNFKPTTFRDDAMHRWLARLRTVAPAPLPPRSGGRAARQAWRAALDPAYYAHTPAEWAALARAFGADYALVDARQTPTPPAGAPVYRAGRWAVYALDPTAAGAGR